MTQKRRGLGKGLGALIPQSSQTARPVDMFFNGDVPENAANTDAFNSRNTKSADFTKGSDLGTIGVEASSTPPVTAGTESTGQSSTADSNKQNAPKVGTEERSASVETGDPEVDLVPVPGASFQEIDPLRIHANSRQPRTVFDEDDLAELVQSISEVGVLQPIVVRPSREVTGGFELIMGERRWRASQRAGLTLVPAIVRETEDSDLLRDALLENLHRADLNPLEEAAAYRQLLDDFACTQDELSTRIARSRPQISNTLRLLKLPPLVQRRLAAGVLSAGHARALLRLDDAAAMERLAQRIVAEGLSVRVTEEIASLGGVEEDLEQPKTKPRSGQRLETVDALATRLSDRFETRVKIALGKTKGRVTVEFASVEDLNRILDVMAPGDPGLFGNAKGTEPADPAAADTAANDVAWVSGP